jgi:sulfite dehydrogenase (quinone) subunit SoeC
MRPTFSIIAFTVLSGAGYGLLFLASLAILAGQAPAPASLLVGGALVSSGLLASVGHLGQPLRAWRAFSQWRSSWLSREGVAAVITFVPLLGLLAPALAGAAASPKTRFLAALLAVGCVATVFCTSRIYSSLKPIAAWHNRYTLPAYLSLSLWSGTLWLLALDRSSASAAASRLHTAFFIAALVLAPACVLLKVAYWRWLDRQPRRPGAGDAIGLAHLGSVGSFERPHTEDNYLTHEMGFVLARKHAHRLRLATGVLILLAAWLALPLAWITGPAPGWLGVLLGLAGLFVERWLFFAQARHAVMAYYGR